MFKKVIFIVLFIFSKISWAQESEVQPLIIDSISCQGNANTKCEFIVKELYLKVGDYLNEEEVQNAKIRLTLKNLFESVNVTLKKGTQKYHVDLVVEVVEKSSKFTSISATAALVRNGSTGYLSGISFGERNLFGEGKSLIGHVSSNIFGNELRTLSGGITYIDPNLFDSDRYFLKSSINYTIYDYLNLPELHGSTSTSYSLGMGKRIFDFSYLSITGRYINTVSKYKDNSSVYTSNSYYRSLDIEYGWDTENDIYFATEGDKLSLTFNKKYFEGDRLTRESLVLNYKRNYFLVDKHSLSSNVQLRFYELYDENKHYRLNTDLDLTYNYQFMNKSLDSNDKIRKGKVYYAVSPSRYGNNRTTLSHSAGVLLDSKFLGIVNLSLSYWGGYL